MSKIRVPGGHAPSRGGEQWFSDLFLQVTAALVVAIVGDTSASLDAHLPSATGIAAAKVLQV